MSGAPPSRLVPAVLDRAILALTLLLPGAALLSAVAFEGAAGRLTAGLVAAAAVLYAVVAWVAGTRRRLGRAIAHAPARPEADEATPEPLGATALRAIARAGVILVLAAATSLANLRALGAAVALGIGLVIGAEALQLARAERRGDGRFVQEAPRWLVGLPPPALTRY